MRVIAGKARSLRLKTVEGDGTRPTTDRIKETLFNMINNDMYNCRFLDLFSGSGGIGIEALSRGASQAYFVECNKKAAKCIRENLEFTKLIDSAVIMETTVNSAINLLKGKGTFDYIFMDPPYNKLIEKEVMELLADSDILSNDTVIIVEASKETSFDYAGDMGYEIIKEKIYKTNKHLFLKCKL